MGSTMTKGVKYAPYEQIAASVLNDSSSLAEAIEVLQTADIKVCFVLNLEAKLVGTITDGDVRRALLAGETLSCSVRRVMNSSPLTAVRSDLNDRFISTMASLKIFTVPVVDKTKALVGAFLLDDDNTQPQLDNELVIMAGGFGKRLRPYTDKVPKPMVLINGKPMLEHIICKAAAEGFINITISLFYLGEVIRDYFGSGERWSVKIKYVEEPEPLGTGGALNLITPRPNKPFLVTNGDVITEVNFRNLLLFHELSESVATMAVKKHEITNPFGVVSLDRGIITGFEEKPTYISHINAGVYALSPSTLDFANVMERVDMPTLFERAIEANLKVNAFPIHESWSDIGRPNDLAEINSELKSLRV